MDVNLERLIGYESARKLRTLGLHKIAAARLRAEGHNIPGDLDLRSAVQALGTNLYTKNAEYQQILEGLISLDKLTQEA